MRHRRAVDYILPGSESYSKEYNRWEFFRVAEHLINRIFFIDYVTFFSREIQKLIKKAMLIFLNSFFVVAVEMLSVEWQ